MDRFYQENLHRQKVNHSDSQNNVPENKIGLEISEFVYTDVCKTMKSPAEVLHKKAINKKLKSIVLITNRWLDFNCSL